MTRRQRPSSSSRRAFLKTGLAAPVPFFVPRHVLGDDRTPPANERVDIGVIGVGIRGKHLIADMPADGRIVALSDCYLPNIELARKPAADAPERLKAFAQSDGTRCAVFADYRQMIDETRFDAVLISAPDHHHALAAMLACHAGLDIYCEKPLTLTIGEGKRLVETVRRQKRILQVGSQQRSMEMGRFGCEFVRGGGLGKIARVEVRNWPGPLTDKTLPEEPIPDGLQWDLFCGPRPVRPHNWRYWMKDVRQWQGANWRGWDMWRDYSGHLMTNHGAHAVDIVQWALGVDDTGPVEIEPLVDDHVGEMRTCPVVMRYGNGTRLEMVHDKGYYAGGRFEGESGQMVIHRNGFRATPQDMIRERPAPAVAAIWNGKGIVARPHLQNWLDCIKSRDEPNAPVEVGHRSATVCHLAGIARELGRSLRWDPASETFPDDAEANALVDRPRRRGWELPEVS